jgi:hypothetical protein
MRLDSLFRVAHCSDRSLYTFITKRIVHNDASILAVNNPNAGAMQRKRT